MSTKSVSRAFQKMHVTKKSKSTADEFRESFDVVFRWAIPEAVQDMPQRGMYFVGFSSLMTASLLFALIVWATYNSNINTIFLSPSLDSGICEAVARPISGTYVADTNGSWNSNVFFDSSRAIYQFHFQDFRSNNTYWDSMFQSLQVSLIGIGNMMPSQPLDVNLIYWLTWVGDFNVGGSRQYLNFYSDVSVVFDRQYIHGVISNVNSDCNASSASRYDSGSYELITTFSYSEFMSNPSCANTINPFLVGYDPLFDGDEFTVSYDMRSLVTAMAINAGIISLPVLRPLVDSIYSFEYNGVQYASGQFYNTRYPGMDPILCAMDGYNFNATDYNVTMAYSPQTNVSCFFMFKNETYGIPLFNVAGGDYFTPEYCACETDDGAPGPGLLNDNCNVFNFLTGFMTFDYGISHANYQEQNPFLDMVQKVPLADISRSAYMAMFIASANTFTDGSDFNMTEREDAYSFCDLNYTACSIVTINAFDGNNRAVSDYFYQLVNGSCSDSVVIANASMSKLAANPPSPLVESYFECRKTAFSVLLSAVGITVGNINALVPILFLLFVQAYYVLLYWEGKPAVQTYTKEEREDALKALALQLLMMRDNRLPPRRSGSLYKAYPHIHGDAKRHMERSAETLGPRSASPSGSVGDSDSDVDICGFGGSTRILRLLTDELMENAYLNVYFATSEVDSTEKKRQFRKASLLRRKTLMARSVDVEKAPVSGHIGGSDGTSNPLHIGGGGVEGNGVAVLNENFDTTLDTVVEFRGCVSDASGARVLTALLDSLINRLIATAVEGAEEDFWEMSGHTGVLHRMNLDELHTVVLKDHTAFGTYVGLLMKIYQLFQVHIRISYGCSAREVHSFESVTGYKIGPKTYSVSDIEQLYNNALAYALNHHIKLDPL